jgi:hypothetical protein
MRFPCLWVTVKKDENGETATSTIFRTREEFEVQFQQEVDKYWGEHVPCMKEVDDKWIHALGYLHYTSKMIDCRKQAFLWMVGERDNWMAGPVIRKEVERQAEQVFPGLKKYVEEYKERNHIRSFETLKQAHENA